MQDTCVASHLPPAARSLWPALVLCTLYNNCVQGGGWSAIALYSQSCIYNNCSVTQQSLIGWQTDDLCMQVNYAVYVLSYVHAYRQRPVQMWCTVICYIVQNYRICFIADNCKKKCCIYECVLILCVGNEGLMSVSVEQEKYFAAIVSATPSGLSMYFSATSHRWLYMSK